MIKSEANYKFRGRLPGFTVDWKSRRTAVPRDLKSKMRDGNALVLVHGIGDQMIGDSLLNFCKNLYRYYVPKKEIYKSAMNLLIRRKKEGIPALRPVFSFKDGVLEKAFNEWLYDYMPLNPFRKMIYKISKSFNKKARSQRKKWIEKKKEGKFGYEYADIQIIKENNNGTKKGKKDILVFRAYEVYWADRFKAPDWLYVWSMFGSSLIALFKKLDISKPFHFIACLILDLYLLLALIPISVIFLIMWGFYSFNYVLAGQKASRRIQPFAWIKQIFEKYIGDISVYVENPSAAKEIRKVLQDFLAHFGGYKWNDYERKYEPRQDKKEEREDFLNDSFGVTKKLEKFKYLSVIAHSLGTVVSFEVLSKFDDNSVGREITRKIRSFICTGSPLERIRYFWGDKKSRFGHELKNKLAYNWYNFWDFSDSVSTKINTFDPHPVNTICFNKFLGFIFPFSHNNYLKNNLVMGRILEKSLGPEFNQFRKRRVRSETGRHKHLRLLKNPLKMIYTFSVYALILFALGIGGYFCVKLLIHLLSGPVVAVYDIAMKCFVFVNKLF